MEETASEFVKRIRSQAATEKADKRKSGRKLKASSNKTTSLAKRQTTEIDTVFREDVFIPAGDSRIALAFDTCLDFGSGRDIEFKRADWLETIEFHSRQMQLLQKEVSKFEGQFESHGSTIADLSRKIRTHSQEADVLKADYFRRKKIRGYVRAILRFCALTLAIAVLLYGLIKVVSVTKTRWINPPPQTANKKMPTKIKKTPPDKRQKSQKFSKKENKNKRIARKVERKR